MTLKRHEEALVVAERGRTRAFVDLLLERQTGGDGMYGTVDNAPVTIDQILSTINRSKATVIYYSIAAGYLYSWLLVPERGMSTSSAIVCLLPSLSCCLCWNVFFTFIYLYLCLPAC